jgi:hypothetical protein
VRSNGTFGRRQTSFLKRPDGIVVILMPPAGRDAAAGGSVARCTALAPGLFEAVASGWKIFPTASLFVPLADSSE